MKKHAISGSLPSDGAKISDKALLISFSENNIPLFNFTGIWGVRDTLSVQRLLGRAFRTYRTHLRRQPIQEEVKS